MLLGGGSGQVGAGLVEVLARARHLERCLWPSQAAASPKAAGSCAAGDSAQGRPPAVDASSDSVQMQDKFLQMVVGCNLTCGSRSCNFCMLTKDWTSVCTTLWYATDSPSTSSHFSIRLAAIGSLPFLLLQAWYIIVWNEKQRIIMNLILLKIWLEKMNYKFITQNSPRTVRCDALPKAQIQGKYKENDKFNPSHTRLLIHIDLWAANLEMSNASKHEQDCILSSRCTMFFMADDHHVEDTAPMFGFFHQRWTTTPLSLIPRFNSRGPIKLSSVTVLQNLQLSSFKPHMHTPDRPLGEPPTGHQLVWSMNEVLGDCRCSNIESVLSADKRSLFGFIGSLLYHLPVFRSSLFVHMYALLGALSPCNIVP
jgi:hypothetical protein